MEKDVFKFSHYRPYLRARLEAAGARGSKAQVAIIMGVQATYVSQVLQESAHLSLEQAEAANIFFKHTTQEAHYFLLLVQKDRAGTKTLREYFQKQMEDILKSRLVLTERLGKTQQLEDKDRSWYYSSWIPSAVHIATTIPTLRTVERIAEALQVSSEKIVETLEHLEAIGLVRKEGFEFHPGQQEIRLGKDSHYILKHHTNWRLQAMQSLERERLNELHYSGVVSLSTQDVVKIKDLLLESIKNSISVIKESKEEQLFCLTMDFFDLKK
ncbi:TIGR02147 family protein [Bdellovibrio svalbardensis]|uniref:TIGR02147 family protein n=1 Tax=Bdellovibrio svalbardensis TaxID=2972972 RepID=A0ABT6DDJ0_9BACT|nr:TIGR02147 family protein [Bdellovibrio svalbardensis]MDG0814904.1 TIGR02147 family protein [Bdellovibrio svalbardensis]